MGVLGGWAVSYERGTRVGNPPGQAIVRRSILAVSRSMLAIQGHLAHKKLVRKRAWAHQHREPKKT